MKFEPGFDVVKSASRAHYCFWLKEDPPVVHEIALKTIVFLLFLTVVVLTLLGAGHSAVASAIYALYFIFALWLAAVLVFLRTGELEEGSVSVLVEAYLIALLITMFLLAHNLFFPISYFTQRPGLDRSQSAELRIAYAYTFPACLFLSVQSVKVIAAVRRSENEAALETAEKIKEKYSNRVLELVLWSFLHYAIIGSLVWLLVFANEEAVRRIGQILQTFDPL
jgi:hypothetical protein